MIVVTFQNNAFFNRNAILFQNRMIIRHFRCGISGYQKSMTAILQVGQNGTGLIVGEIFLRSIDHQAGGVFRNRSGCEKIQFLNFLLMYIGSEDPLL